MSPVDPLERLIFNPDLPPVWRAVCWSCGVNSEPSDQDVDHVAGWLIEEIAGYSMSLDQIVVAGTRFCCPVCGWEAEPAILVCVPEELNGHEAPGDRGRSPGCSNSWPHRHSLRPV